MPVKDAKAWSSMIIGFAIHGLTKEALETFANMEEAKVEPNHVTLISVLSACAHGGLVAKGKKNWSSMPKSRIEPSMEHYGCMVDLLCRANQTEEAYEFVKNMPTTPSPTIWRTLLVSCKKNKMLEKGEIVAEQLL
ncbi:pentatricopeptide repeat-containing protein At1g26900, mitochondrial-like [Sesamum indicum]|uniref:Pentatricopeptide repeat-containing protein At1g26900, mitochondrial-like n=1 Tax=Sesamum indicum TaxID=4182 RepID=A0A8M8USC9_SESIN|nr:pentatricopeptide repeat-containing protein At1g26900, mitochondrial-like [Sesamum indicum]